MAIIYVYNTATNGIETYTREEHEAMPYNIGGTLTVREFRGSSKSTVLWTTVGVMQAWNSLREMWGQNIYIGYAFKRIWEGGHGYQSQHYAGVALDIAQNLTNAMRSRLRSLAESSGQWSYVEPAYLTPTWVHVDKRYGIPACAAGYPMIRQGSRGVYVFIAQDALNALGYTGSGLDGIFGAGMREAVRRFQTAQGLAADGIVGCTTWTRLTRTARGIGRTATVVRP